MTGGYQSRKRKGSTLTRGGYASQRSKKRVARRRPMNISRPMRFSSIPKISVTRTCYLGNFIPDTVSTNGFWQYRTVSLTKGFLNQNATSLGGLTNLSEYTALFDSYKMNAFKVVLRPRISSINRDQDVPTAGTTIQEIPYCTVIKDSYDNTAPTGTYTAANLNTLLEDGRAKTYRADRPITIFMKPKVIEQYGSGADRYVTPKFTRLNNSNGQDMPHRGFHTFFHMQNFAALGALSYDVWITYYLQFRGQA